MEEQALEPDLPICDPHHHLWDRPDSRYMLEELTADIDSGHHVERTVFVECGSGYRMEDSDPMRVVGETRFVTAADPGGRIGGIVGFADLRVPEIADVLAAHVEAGQGRFRGIRHASAFDPSPDIRRSHTNPPAGLLADPAFRSGFAALGRAGLSFDAWLYHRQIPELTDLAKAQPEVPVILDHLGGPLGIGPYAGKEDEVLGEWRAAIRELASCPNVTVKLGGIGMAIYGKGWHRREGGASSDELAQAWGDPIRFCIEHFGADRCMFESNFPVDKVSCSYVVLWNGFKKIAAGASPSEKDALFRRSAEAAYRLPPLAA